MPVNRLLVEGRLEREIFLPLLAGISAVSEVGSKGSLAPRARDLRRDSGTTVCFIRDRDFDHLPPNDLSQPTVDTDFLGTTLGWRWCRHEIENYLIDPAVVEAVFGWDRAVFEAEMRSAAKSIRHYQTARWTIGQARQVLPPARELPSKPAECDRDFKLPADMTEAGTETWVQTQAATFLAGVQTPLAPAQLTADLASHAARFTDAFLADVPNLLVWFSGKDLLGGMMPWLQSTHSLHPSQFRIDVRDWMTANPDQTFALLPEWTAFRTLLHTYP